MARDSFGGAELWVLAHNVTGPAPDRNGWNKNSDSTVLQIVYGWRRVILSGDATTTTETYALAQAGLLASLKLPPGLPSDVLKVGHHGSQRTSSCPGWIEAVNPSYVFVTADRHGFSDEDEKQTGHRLPQEITMEVIRQNAKNLARNCTAHTYVSHYDPKDYTELDKEMREATGGKRTFPNPRATQPDPFDINTQGWPPGWKGIQTCEGIFTTIVGMDRTTSDGAEAADIGCQYALIISEDGAMRIDATS